MTRHNHNTKGAARRGSIIVCILACMVVATALVGSTLRTALQTRRHMRPQLELRQAELVLEAGIARASQRLSTDGEYQGETWELKPTTLPGIDRAVVEISVDREHTWPPEVTVIARLGSNRLQNITRSYSFPLQLSLSPLGD